MCVLVLCLGTAGLVLLLATVQHSHVITLLCPRRQDPTAGHTGRLDKEKRTVGEEVVKLKHITQRQFEI